MCHRRDISWWVRLMSSKTKDLHNLIVGKHIFHHKPTTTRCSPQDLRPRSGKSCPRAKEHRKTWNQQKALHITPKTPYQQGRLEVGSSCVGLFFSIQHRHTSYYWKEDELKNVLRHSWYKSAAISQDDEDETLQQDDVPKHTAKETLSWFQRKKIQL